MHSQEDTQDYRGYAPIPPRPQPPEPEPEPHWEMFKLGLGPWFAARWVDAKSVGRDLAPKVWPTMEGLGLVGFAVTVILEFIFLLAGEPKSESDATFMLVSRWTLAITAIITAQHFLRKLYWAAVKEGRSIIADD